MICSLRFNNPLFTRRRVDKTIIIGLVFIAFGGCRDQAAPPPPPTPMVEVATVERGALTEYYQYNGVLKAKSTVEVRARVRGFVERIEFEPSSNVKEGDLLFVLEQDRYQAAVDRADGMLQQARARLELAQTTFDRVQRVFAKNAASEDEMSNARAELSQRQAEVKTAEADLKDAEIDLSYTEIRAPLTGRVDDHQVDIGDLVGATEATLLCTIVQMDPIHAYFDVSERIVMEYLERGKDGTINETTPPAFLGLINEEGFPHKGRIDYVDNQLDPATGTLSVRGHYDNPNTLLYPGLFCRIRVPATELDDAILVYEKVVGAGLDGKYVMIVGENNEVSRQSVKLGERTDDGRIHVIEGLQGGERYIVEGLQRARPGMPVKPEAYQAPKPMAKENDSAANAEDGSDV